ncbi:thiamine diphosphokinase [Spiroplasma sp. DGKH1]|uniref:thiamine diphosphokinase n=1 Tax=Spiroplasma sp. DGKH1 TaxID=3050074 RepID=UPI0034C641AF
MSDQQVKVLIVCSQTNLDLTQYADYYHIGVERGCLALLNHKLTIDLACGDFDSLSPAEYQTVIKNTNKLVKVSAIKNEIDAELAITEALKLQPAEIILITQGPRVDMQLASFGFIAQYNVKWLNDDNYCYLLKPHQVNVVIPQPGYRYLSFISLTPAKVNIAKMKYNVQDFEMTALSANAISNEFIYDQPGEIEVLSGTVIVIYTK